MGCTGMPEVEMISGRNKCEIYRNCGGDAQVGYCSLEGTHFLYQQNALNIADYAWKFFDKHALPLPDADGDGIDDQDDNCVNVANPDQADADGDCIGDACECSTPADCDDGMFCNGSETCTNGACSAAAAPCAAGQACDEASRQCGVGGSTSRAGTGGSAGGVAGGGVAGTGPANPAVAGVAGAPVSTSAGAGGAAAIISMVGASGAAAVATTVGASTAAGSGSATQPVSGPTIQGCGCNMLGSRQAAGRSVGASSLGFLLLLASGARRHRQAVPARASARSSTTATNRIRAPQREQASTSNPKARFISGRAGAAQARAPRRPRRVSP
jgi:hypothetical protein